MRLSLSAPSPAASAAFDIDAIMASPAVMDDLFMAHRRRTVYNGSARGVIIASSPKKKEADSPGQEDFRLQLIYERKCWPQHGVPSDASDQSIDIKTLRHPQGGLVSMRVSLTLLFWLS